MERIGEFIECVRPTYDDDAVDRLNYFWTTVLTFLLSALVLSCQWGGDPVQCWTPREFTSAWENYVERNCFMENTYRVANGWRRQIRYYPWVPFLLGMQATFFYLPHFIWNQLSSLTGLDIQSMLTKLKRTSNRRLGGLRIAGQLYRAMRVQTGFNPTPSLLTLMLQCGKASGIYVTGVYLSVKALFLINVVTQWLLLNRIFGIGWTHVWGFQLVLRYVLPPYASVPSLPPLFLEHYSETIPVDEHELWDGLFPRVTYCSVRVRSEGERYDQQLTLQCVLWINMVNEKVFLILWWWYLVLSVLTACNLLYWSATSLLPMCQRRFIRRYLSARHALQGGSQEHLIDTFIASTLKVDGILTLRILSSNLGELYPTDVCELLWWRFYRSKFGGRMDRDGTEYV